MRLTATRGDPRNLVVVAATPDGVEELFMTLDELLYVTGVGMDVEKHVPGKHREHAAGPQHGFDGVEGVAFGVGEAVIAAMAAARSVSTAPRVGVASLRVCEVRLRPTGTMRTLSWC